MLEAALEAIEKIRRKTMGESMRYRLTKEGKRLLQQVEWIRDEVEKTKVEITHGTETRELEGPRHTRAELHRIIKERFKTKDVWIEKSDKRRMGERIWKL
jgi:hypothetical protein